MRTKIRGVAIGDIYDANGGAFVEKYWHIWSFLWYICENKWHVS